MKIAFETLGCKINQFDTAVMQEQAAGASKEIVPFHEEADVYVINTCSVTRRSDSESRQLIRRALRRNPLARIVVTGCYAQTHPDELLQIPGVDLVLGTREKGNWLEYLGGCEKAAGPSAAVETDFSKAFAEQPLIRRFGDRTRAFVKVQDGCDSRCSFCLIPRARGPSRSVATDHVIEQVRWLAQNGYQEIVLTGVNLGFYGRDEKPKGSLAGLIRRILKNTSIPRIRISSVEPKTVTRELVSVVRASPRICPHLHIPLQSGSDRILKAMNRHYSARFYQSQIRTLVDAVPDINIGADVMVGFPGEGEKEFEQTYALLAGLPMAYFHVFPYSPRPLTAASEMGGQVSKKEKQNRSMRLRNLSVLKTKQFSDRFRGTRRPVLLEVERDAITGQLQGFTDNYLRVQVEGPDSLMNSILPVTLTPTEAGWVGRPDFRPGQPHPSKI
jgi:threonylcarbamoyladenosine tRNA methylthiotransferase MtaB